ncbi:cell division topological specificity factor MinE [Candidatus Desulforudis audaxviator]|uniref:Cell division topological specificity factor n=1 Tax=Desulforudis audaxviator (strain MP104C) TaxID=477974 RepID=MINE_DESAP|nr:RecName: Full=Cell division topological specificity factor [Candidatus Desulforudis audaxviator MP104C]ACA59966.1 cell division topological specificity factor MinE [Candidatus Desulforudis audaxviator MP104C]
MDFLARLLGRESPGSKNVAKERLRLVLIHDRADISPQLLQLLKNEIVEVISKYMEIDDKGLEVSLEHVDKQVALVANIPIRKMKRAANI